MPGHIGIRGNRTVIGHSDVENADTELMGLEPTSRIKVVKELRPNDRRDRTGDKFAGGDVPIDIRSCSMLLTPQLCSTTPGCCYMGGNPSTGFWAQDKRLKPRRRLQSEIQRLRIYKN